MTIIYANDGDLNILHYPELARYRFNVCTKQDEHFNTAINVDTQSENALLLAQVTRLTADIEALKVQLQSENEAATSLANAVVSLTSEKIRLTAQNAIAMEALEKIENNGCDCDSWESCRNNHVSTSQDALSRIRELEAAK